MGIHIFNVNRVSDELRRGEVTQAAALRYLLLNLAIRFWSSLSSTHPYPAQMKVFIFSTLVEAISLSLIFKTNERGDNRDFVHRYFCLSAPLLLWRCLILTACSYGLFYGVRQVMGIGTALFFASGRPGGIGVTIIGVLTHYMVLNFYFWRTSTQPTAIPLAPISTP